MFILSLDTGYVHVELEEPGKYVLVDHEEGIPCKLKIRKKTQSVGIIPIGQIVVNRYNQSLKSYLDNGGSVEEVLRLHKDHKIKLEAPYPPVWFNPDEKPKEYELSEISLADDPTYLKVAYIQFMGQLTPIFDVDKLDDLYFYDLFRMKSSVLCIRECEDCGKAFLAKTTAVRCANCRKAGLGEKKKRDNIKNDPARQLVYRIKDRNKNGKRNVDLAYPNYYANLCYVIQSHTENDSPDDLLKFAKNLDSMDKRYFKLCKFFDEYCYDKSLIREWSTEKSKFPADIENPEQWIEQWYKKAGLSQ